MERLRNFDGTRNPRKASWAALAVIRRRRIDGIPGHERTSSVMTYVIAIASTGCLTAGKLVTRASSGGSRPMISWFHPLDLPTGDATNALNCVQDLRARQNHY
jgi:hypothetical protein